MSEKYEYVLYRYRRIYAPGQLMRLDWLYRASGHAMSMSAGFRYAARRLALMAVTLIGISVVSFSSVYLLPGDPMTSRYPQASEEELAALRSDMGLDQPLYVQYGRYIESLAHGDLGWSYNTGTPVREDLAHRLPASVELSVFALLLAIIIGVPLGMVSAIWRNRLTDHLARIFSIGTLSIPVFWTGLVGIYIFSYTLGWAPAPLGRLALTITPPPSRTGLLLVDSLLAGNGEAFWGALQALALPATVLGLSMVAPLSRITRSAMSEALQEDFILFARATGVPEHEIVMRDALRASLVPVLTIAGYLLGYLVAGNALVEMVFSWPGIGRYAVQAVLTTDMAPINAILLVLAVAVAFANLLVDLTYALVDPRIRHGILGA
jgi:peptide/nickel transport system permease protein